MKYYQKKSPIAKMISQDPRPTLFGAPGVVAEVHFLRFRTGAVDSLNPEERALSALINA